ncbi:MAG: PKD domain-containing protein [Acidobacteriota bacterium]
MPWLLALADLRAATLTRGPYLQMGTPSNIVIRWRTDVPTDSVVSYGPSPGNLSNAVTDPTSTTEHVVSIPGLTPSTTYFYAIGSTSQTLAGGDRAHAFVTSPPAGVATPLRIWVLGDSGTADVNARAVRDAYYGFTGLAPTSFWIMLGDNAYASGLDLEYQAAVFDTYPSMLGKSVLWPAFGNADGNSANSSTETGPYYDVFTLPRAAEAGGVASGTEAYFAFEIGNVHFVCLNSVDVSRQPSGAMMTWLQQDLAATTAQWIVALWHHAPYSKGSHDSDVDIEMIEMRTNFLPALEQAGVDLVLSGHSHSYERSFLIDGHYGDSTTFGPGNLKDGGDGRITGTGAYEKPSAMPAPHEGTVYTVAGSSGDTNGGPLNHPAMYTSLNLLGSVVLDVDGDRLDGKFLDGGGVVRDSYTVIKGAPAGSPQAEMTGSPLSGVAPLNVAFTDLSRGGPTSWSWDFGDGATSAAQNPVHAYRDAGTYTVTLVATNGAGASTAHKPGYVKVTEVTQEIVTGAGAAAGNAPVVKTWNHATPPGTVSSWGAYGAPDWGANVAAVDMVAGGTTEVATGPGPGPSYGPQVRGFSATGGALSKVNFYAYGTLRYGVHPGGGDLDGDGHHEILTTPGPGAVFGPHVRGWNYDNAAISSIAKISFFAYSTLRYGARVAGGSIDMDPYAEIVTGVERAPSSARTSGRGTTTTRRSWRGRASSPSARAGSARAWWRPERRGRRARGRRGPRPDPAAGADVAGFDVAGASVSVAWTITAFATSAVRGRGREPRRERDRRARGGPGLGGDAITGRRLLSGGKGRLSDPGLLFTAYAAQSYGAKVAVGETGTP